jgi:hypothetical protein
MTAGPDDPYGRDGGLRPAGDETQTLSYISELVEELKGLAERSGFPTLASILGAALTESRVQQDEQNR